MAKSNNAFIKKQKELSRKKKRQGENRKEKRTEETLHQWRPRKYDGLRRRIRKYYLYSAGKKEHRTELNEKVTSNN